MDYLDYIHQVRRFKRDSILLSVTETCWRVWNPEVHSYGEPRNDTAILVRAYAPRLFAISAATGDNHRNKSATVTDILNLSNLVLSIKEALSDQDFMDQEINGILEALVNSKFLKNYIISEELTKFCTKSIFIQRLLRAQWDAAGYSHRDLLRSWMIYKALDLRTAGATRKVVKKIYNLDPLHAFRSAYFLYHAMAYKKNEDYRGIVDFDQFNISSVVENRLGIDLDTLRLIGSKMCQDLSSYQQWHNEVLGLPKYYRHYAPLPLYRSPLISSEEIVDGYRRTERKNKAYICPSPQIFFGSLSDLFFRDLRENQHLLPHTNISSFLGYALEDYLEVMLPKIFSSCQISRPGDTSSDKNADFIIESDSAVFVVEVKKAFGDAPSRTIADPKAVVSVWDRILRSYIQCAASINEYKEKKGRSKPVIGIVIVGNSVLGEQAIFDFLAYHSGIHQLLGLDYIELMSLDSFERAFLFCGIDEMAKTILGKWERIRSSPNINHFFSLEPICQKSSDEVPDLLQDAIDELIP